jgi:phosphate/sulfate permease
MVLSSKSGAAMVMAAVMGGAITVVGATIMAGAEATATTMVGGTIIIGNLFSRSEEAASRRRGVHARRINVSKVDTRV